MESLVSPLYAVVLSILGIFVVRRIWRYLVTPKHYHELQNDEPINFYAAKVAKDGSKRFKKTNLLNLL
jgi:hypothetical protein